MTLRPWSVPSCCRPSLTVAFDLPAQHVGRRHQRRLPAVLLLQGKPDAGRAGSELLLVHLEDVRAQLRQGLGGLAGDGVEDRGLEARVPLAADVVHDRGRHSGLLQLAEGLAGIDGPQLPAVAHHHQPRHAQMLRAPHEGPHLRSAGERHLVHHQHLAGHGPFRPGRGLAKARQEPLQGPGGDAGLAAQRAPPRSTRGRGR